MPLTEVLQRIAWLTLLPSLVMWPVAVFGPVRPPSELVTFCIKYWWITFVIGATLFVTLRSVAWAMQKAGIR